MLKLYAARPNYTVIGTTLGEIDLPGIVTGENTKLITIPMDVRDVNSPKAAIQELKEKLGITKFDVVRTVLARYV